YFHPLPYDQRVTHERLARICFIDYNRQVVLVAEAEGEDGTEIRGIGRLNHVPNTEDAEFALLISDTIQGTGLGTELLRRLLEIAPKEGIHRVIGYVLPENHGMLKVCEKLGFTSSFDSDEKVYKSVIEV
ncbi:MAG: GNAT family N-acetyltransferase, partial [Candidatus Omnitrophica bacterium]|nr:GNAT family N-acetyltransferase [Candidatus Omnitrophota bacterium]